MNNKLAILDKNGKTIGFKTKEECHLGKGIFHLAFSIYIFNKKGQLLIQQRSKFKKLWPLYWSNSCCSHQRSAGDCVEEAGKRLKEELGFTVPLKKVGSFEYGASYKNIGAENELCAILIGEYNGRIKKNSEEAANWKWVDLPTLLKDISDNSGKYTPWFKIGLKRYLKILENSKAAQKELIFILNDTAKKIDPEIKKFLTAGILKRFHNVVNYQISAGGKRLRPILAILSCFLFGGKMKDVSGPAAGLEILHNYTLIIDDIIDHSVLRRNKPTVWSRFGRSIAECVGIDYSVAIFEAASYSKKPAEISKILVRTMKTIIEGEIYDILFEQSGRKDEPYVIKNRYLDITKKDYYQMVNKKTAALLQNSCEIGALCANASVKDTELIKNYGFNLGVAFQLQDDFLDIFGEEAKLGKKIGKDIEERKLGNIVILSALEELSDKDKKEFLKIIRKERKAGKDIKKVIKLIKKTNSRARVRDLTRSFIDKAKINLESLPQNKWNKTLMALADFIAEREK